MKLTVLSFSNVLNDVNLPDMIHFLSSMDLPVATDDIPDPPPCLGTVAIPICLVSPLTWGDEKCAVLGLFLRLYSVFRIVIAALAENRLCSEPRTTKRGRPVPAPPTLSVPTTTDSKPAMCPFQPLPTFRTSDMDVVTPDTEAINSGHSLSAH